MTTLGYYKSRSGAKDPLFATLGSACFDVSACLDPNDKVIGYNRKNEKYETEVKNFWPPRTPSPRPTLNIDPMSRVLVPSGLILDIPRGYSVRLHPRSGLSLKSGVVLANCEGVIDSDYVNELMIMVLNISTETVSIEHGDRIAQAELVENVVCKIGEQLNPPKRKTDRDGGFGSTGKS
tara:strand:+ start:346 stop:882 length:537 start_codon:yes stop_codon:yes gene_type:complete